MLIRNLGMCVARAAYYSFGYMRASLMGVRLGAGARVSPFAKVKGAAYIGSASIGRDVELGRGSYINSGEITCGKIGRWCSLGYGVLIGPTEHDYRFGSTSPHFPGNELIARGPSRAQLGPPVLEDDVWVGAHAIVLKGVRIARGAVVGAAAVVTGDLPEYAIAVGAPARVIGYRFPDDAQRAAASELLDQRVADLQERK